MKFWNTLIDKIRKKLNNTGYTCDGCGKEIFHYPIERLCEDCQESLQRNDGNTCEKCGRKTVAEGICLTCKSVLPTFTRGFSPFVYRAETAGFINRVKNGKPRLACYFGERMAENFLAEYRNLPALGEGEKVLVLPVPLTNERKRARGYNQAERLAEVVCDKLNEAGIAAELGLEILQKTRETGMQKHMSAQGRRENVAGAYHVHQRKACYEKRILLIDDILTTGATTSECADRLFGAGAKEVYVLVAGALPERKTAEKGEDVPPTQN